jgi:ferredoxin
LSKIEIYYFSGTGNSLHVAKELQKQIPNSSLEPIVSYLKKDVAVAKGETVGFVFPIHGMTVPIPVRKLIKEIDLRSTKYIFAVATRGGTKCFAANVIEKILKKKGKKLNSFFILTIANNDPKLGYFEIPTKKEIAQIDSKIQNRIKSIKEIIINREKYRKKDTNGVSFPFIKPIRFLLERLILIGMKYAEHQGGKDYFYSDSKCTGCEICQKVCLSGMIKMVKDKPLWQKNIKCYFCYACLNYCPVQSVQIKSSWYMKSYTKKKGRYPHPFAKASDIARQKDQITG